jgi:hypothetical protein
MTDLEISKALALAIGWHEHRVRTVGTQCYVVTFSTLDKFKPECGWPFWIAGRVFDYRDWNVIGPIAAKYNAFPRKHPLNWWSWYVETATLPGSSNVTASTPQKAIALAVIGAIK